MEGHLQKIAEVEVCGKMHQHVFDGEGVDLHQIMKDVYENLNSISEVILESDFYKDNADLEMHIEPLPLVKVCGFLIAFLRCTLKWCVGGDGTINRSLVENLIDVESHLVAAAQLLLCCNRVLADKDLWPPKQSFENLAIVDHLVPKIAEVYPVVLTAASSPFDFIVGEESVLKFFGLVGKIRLYCTPGEQTEENVDLFFTMSEEVRFMRYYFQFIIAYCGTWNKFLICVEAVIDKMACFTFLKYFCSSSNQQSYSHLKKLLGSQMRVGILKVLTLLPDSCPLLSDELLMRYVDCVQQNITRLLEDEATDLTSEVDDHFRTLHITLDFLVFMLSGFKPKPHDNQEELFAAKMNLQTVARDVGFIIYLCINNEMMQTEMSSVLFDLVGDVRFIRDEVNDLTSRSREISLRKKSYIVEVVAPSQALIPSNSDGSRDYPGHVSSRALDGSKDTIHVMSEAFVPAIDVFVGFEVEMKLIRERLAGGLLQRDVVSVIGMAGIGKTTLARKVYEDPFILNYFQVRAWCYVSQEYHKKDLLLTILGSIIELTDLIHKMKDGDLSIMVHKQLMGRRYLIVMDDIWGIEVYEDLKRFFPDDGCGSRVLLTSRNKSISLQANGDSDPLELRLLTDEESWDLLEQKVYLKEECPLELCQVGKKIAQKCGGLPLAVVLVAGVLFKSDKKMDLWEQVAQSLFLHIADDSERHGVLSALELSYKMLPDYLKPLFLYVGAFPDSKVIPAGKLIWLWIAEGFVVERTSQELRSLEDQAELYLKDLIDRNLLMVVERRSSGRVKSCRAHDLLRFMCLAKAKEERFLHQIHASGELPSRIICGPRLSISLGSEHESSNPTPSIDEEVPPSSYLPTLSITSSLHSFLFFNKIETSPSRSYWEEVIKSVLCNFELLRIFHFENTSLEEDLCNDLTRLVNLRYISIQALWTHIPLSVCRLWSLETLIVKGLRGEIVVPDAIWEMVKLRHLHVNGRAAISDPPDSSYVLENLVTLSTPALQGNEKKLIASLLNLRKLRCIFLDPPESYEFPHLESLVQLESLKVSYHGSVQCFGIFNLPSSLKKLSLSKFHLQWKEISSFQNLPNLEVLKLRCRSVNGELWDTEEEDCGFPKLKYLKLESLNIKQWNACAGNFPCLEKLVLQRCKQLQKIPDLGDFYSLQKIEVLWCNSSLADITRLIQEEHEDQGSMFLKVYTYPPQLDLDSSS